MNKTRNKTGGHRQRSSSRHHHGNHKADFLDMDGGPNTDILSARQQKLRDKILKQRNNKNRQLLIFLMQKLLNHL